MKAFINFMIWFAAIPIWSLIFLIEMYMKLIFERDLKLQTKFGEFIEGILL